MDELNKVLQYNNKESPMFIPNEIFGELIGSKIKDKHVPFAYSYYYLVSWLYRNCKYGSMDLDNKQMKEILGYNPTYTEIDYIIKKGGVLDNIGYTITEKDYPISWSLDNGELEFTMLSDLDEESQKVMKSSRSRKYNVKFPVKAFYREDEEVYDGTFFQIDNTHEVPFEVFLFCMSNKNIGCTGFYLWCYLKMQTQIYKGYDISVEDLSVEIGISRSTLTIYLKRLKQHKMIECIYNQEFFCIALKKEDRMANTYIAREWNEFSKVKVEVEKIRYKSKKEYLEQLKHESEVDYDVLFE